MTPVEFRAALLARGIEFTLSRTNRLRVWPWAAYRTLTDDERDFIRRNRQELKRLAAQGAPSPATAYARPQPDAADRVVTRATEQTNTRMAWDSDRNELVRDFGITI